MGLWTDIVGSVRGYIRLGLTGVRLKNSSGALAVRNAGDSADANITCADLTLSGKLFALLGAQPGGRLTLSSGVPVMTSDVSNSTSIYYTPYVHDRVPIYDGTNWAMTTFTELTNTTTDNTKNPAAVGADSNYDLFIWNDSGTIRLSRGPAWASATARGTGAGTTELERVNGILVNKIAITNGPAAQRGTYVGTVRSDASSTIDWELGGNAANGDPIFLYVWNAYNRVDVIAACGDTTDNWTYGTASWRNANNSASNRASFVRGLNEDAVLGFYNGLCNPGATEDFAFGCELDGAGKGTTNSRTYSPVGTGAGIIAAGTSFYAGIPGLGYHFLQASEYALSGTVMCYGDQGGTTWQTALVINGRF